MFKIIVEKHIKYIKVCYSWNGHVFSIGQIYLAIFVEDHLVTISARLFLILTIGFREAV